jgi:hypothetical protein
LENNFKIKILYDFYDIDNMDDNELILVIDDCVYSGLQLSKVLNINYNGIINKIYE